MSAAEFSTLTCITDEEIGSLKLLLKESYAQHAVAIALQAACRDTKREEAEQAVAWLAERLKSRRGGGRPH